MAANGIRVYFTASEISQIKRKIASYDTVRAFCAAHRIQPPTLHAPLKNGRASERIYKKLIKAKYCQP